AEHDLVGAPAHVLGAHDLVGVAGLQHAVLVDARGMRKGVGADTALFGCTTKPVICDTRREVGTMCVVSIAESSPKKSLRVFTAITTSSSEVLPARSPRPLMVHSICRAPPIITAASELATAMPKSLWQCTLHTALSELGILSLSVLMNSPNCCGTA